MFLHFKFSFLGKLKDQVSVMFSKMFRSLLLIFIAAPSFADEINLFCKDRNGLNTYELLLDTAANTASVTNNGAVSHACTLNRTATLYMLNCPSLNGGQSVDRNTLQYIYTIYGSLKSTSDCEIVNVAKPKI